MSTILANWKTTLAGVGTILSALGDIAASFSKGNTGHIQADITAIIAGIGLLVAKDFNKTS